MTQPNIYDPKDPTPEMMLALAGPADGTGTFRGLVRETVPISTGSANAATNWVNNSGHAVAATVKVVFTTAGSGGTFDAGVSQDGTGSNDNIINGGTVGVVQVVTPGTVSSTAVTGNDNQWFVINGSGTNNSIVMTHNDAGGTGTVGGVLTVEYFPVDA